MPYFAVKEPKNLKGVYSDEEEIKKLKGKLIGRTDVSYRSFKDGHKERALNWINGIEKNKNSKYLAIRKPEELKGVYLDTDEVEKLTKELTGRTGSSYRTFNIRQEELALKWIEGKKNLTILLLENQKN